MTGVKSSPDLEDWNGLLGAGCRQRHRAQLF